MSTNNGGAAFPDPGRAQSAKQREFLTETGMSLLDYFVAHAPITFEDARKAAHDKGTGDAVTYGEILEMLATLRISHANDLLARRTISDSPSNVMHNQLIAALKSGRIAIDVLMAQLIEVDPSFVPTQSAAWPALVAIKAALDTAEV